MKKVLREIFSSKGDISWMRCAMAVVLLLAVFVVIYQVLHNETNLTLTGMLLGAALTGKLVQKKQESR